MEARISAEVSIIVICYNEERQVSSCLHALLNQNTRIPFEVIVVDDGSTDSTVKVVSELQVHSSNLRLLRHELNLGRGAARRTGQDATETSFVGFVDADVIVPVDWLSRCLDALDMADGVSGIALPDGDCAVLWRICRPTLRHRKGSAEITGNNVLFSKNALERVQFSSVAKLGEDFRLAKLMVQRGLRLQTIGDLIVEHRESKTYWKGVTWMWQSGVDATALLFEFRVIRIPDLAWLGWSACMIGFMSLTAVGALGILTALVLAIILTLLIDTLFIGSRFSPRSKFLRFMGALVLSPPLIATYLVGRCVGVFSALSKVVKSSSPQGI